MDETECITTVVFVDGNKNASYVIVDECITQSIEVLTLNVKFLMCLLRIDN